MEHTGLLPSTDTAIDLCKDLVVYHLEKHQTCLGIHDLVRGGVLLLLMQSLGLCVHAQQLAGKSKQVYLHSHSHMYTFQAVSDMQFSRDVSMKHGLIVNVQQ